MADPVRTCVGCRQRAPLGELLRVVARHGAVVPDVRRRLPGRGAHLHPTAGCLDLAVRRKALPRALRVTGPLDVTELRKLTGSGASSRPNSPAGPSPAPTPRETP